MNVLSNTDTWNSFITCRVRLVQRLNVHMILQYQDLTEWMRKKAESVERKVVEENLGIFTVVDLLFYKETVLIHSVSDENMLNIFEKSNSISFRKGTFKVCKLFVAQGCTEL